MEYNETMLQARKIALDLLNTHGSLRAVQRESGVNAYTIKNLADGHACVVTDAALKRLGVDVTTKIDGMIGVELHDELVRKFGGRAQACSACKISHTQLSSIKNMRPPQLQVRKRIEAVIFGDKKSSDVDVKAIARSAWV